MRKRKKDLLFYGGSAIVFLALLTLALIDPADRATHVRAYLYGAGVAIMIAGLVAKLLNKI